MITFKDFNSTSAIDFNEKDVGVVYCKNCDEKIERKPNFKEKHLAKIVDFSSKGIVECEIYNKLYNFPKILFRDIEIKKDKEVIFIIHHHHGIRTMGFIKKKGKNKDILADEILF